MEFKAFSEKQLRVLTWWCEKSRYAKKDAIICDGAVRSGKTVCMGISFIAWAFYRFDGANFAMCGKTIRSLKRNVVTAILPVLQQLGFTCTEKLSQNLLEVSIGGRTNCFYLFGGRDESSASLIQGMTLSGVLFDEVALMPKSFVEQALARCSVEGSKFWFNCNPQYPQHWFRQEWILDKAGKNALYIHFKMEDNPSLSPKMLARYKNLYTGTFYQRFIEGKWVSAQGLVYPFMTADNMCWDTPKTDADEFVISCDYGTVNPASFGLWGHYIDGWYRVDEYYYDSRKEGVQKTDEEHYQGLCRLAQEKTVRCVIVDPSAASFMEVIRRHGRFKVLPASNCVLDGIRSVASALKQGEIKICKSCTDALREFGLYRWKENGLHDAPVKENDHAMDDIRYFVSTYLNRSDDGIFAIAARRTGGKAWD